jgi:hypothetical protein
VVVSVALAGWLLAVGQGVAAWLPDTVQIGRLSLAYDEWTVVLSRLQLERRAEAPLALSIDRIEGPTGVVPLWASLRLGSRGAGWRLDGVVASGRGELVLRFNGAGSGGTLDRLTAAMEPLRFEPGALQPVGLWPGFGRLLRDVQGSIGLSLDWQRGQPGMADLALDIAGLAFATDYGPVELIDGSIRLDRLWPPRTAMPQWLRIEGLDIGRLVERLEVEALAIEGIMDAELGFSFTEAGRLYIEKSRREARGPGAIRYRPAEPPPLLESQGANVDLLVAALADFRYDAATATVEGFVDGEISIALQLQGANPELYEGYPIELNLSLEAPVLALVGAGREAIDLPFRLRRALQEPGR